MEERPNVGEKNLYSPEELQTQGVADKSTAVASGNTPIIEWSATEFVSHDKTPLWYLGLLGVAAVLTILVFLFTKDKTATIVVIVAAIALGVYAGRQPRQLTYALFNKGITVGQRTYSYYQFRSFWVDHEGMLTSISLMPHKRFGQLVSLYFDPRDEQAIVSALANYLPLEHRTKDLVDKLLLKIRF